jgi:membrane protease YdiL (CAAX protease family)
MPESDLEWVNRRHGRILNGASWGMTSESALSWTRFWDRGGFWRALLLAAVYYPLYLAAGYVLGRVGGVEPDTLMASAGNLFWGQVAALFVGGAILLAFGASVGWLDDVFGAQPIGGRWWMWLAPLVVLGFNALRFAAADYDAFDPALVVVILLLGVGVGFAEELLTRGYAVTMLRAGGHSEWVVAALSSLIFALLHIGNLFGGQSPLTVGLTVVYTFGFGVMMYLTLRVTGRLIWPMIIHATTDASGILLTGGIDEVTGGAATGALAGIAGLANIVVAPLGLLLLLFVRGHVGRRTQEPTPKPVT